MPHATNADLRLFWDEKGTGSPLLLVMGATYSSQMWYPVIDALAERHRVIWFDNRGIGRSQPTRHGSIEDMARDAVAVLDAAGVDRAHVYGASLGGVVVLQLVLQSPDRVRSMILGCTGILSADKPRAPRLMNLLCYVPAGLRRRLLSRLGRGSYGSAAPTAAIETDLAAICADRTSSAGLLQQQNALRAYSVDRTAVENLDVPALVLHGTEDGTVPLAYGEELAEALPQGRLVTFAGAAHNYLVACRDQANDTVAHFLADVDRAAAVPAS